MNDIVTQLTEILNTLSSRTSSFVSAVREAFPPLADLTLSTEKLKQVLNVTSDSVTELANRLTSFYEWAKRGTSEMDKLVSAFHAFDSNVAAYRTAVASVESSLKKALEEARKSLASKYPDLVKEFGEGFNEINKIIVEGLSKGETIDKVKEGVKKAIAAFNPGTVLKGALSQFRKAVREKYSEVLESVRKTASAVPDAFAKVTESAHALTAAVNSAVKGLEEKGLASAKFTEALKNLGQTLGKVTEDSNYLAMNVTELNKKFKEALQDLEETRAALEGIHPVAYRYAISLQLTSKNLSEFSKQINILPSPLKRAAEAVASVYKRLSGFVISVANLRGILQQLIHAVKSLHSTTLAIVSAVVVLLDVLRQALVRGLALQTALTKGFGELSFAFTYLNKTVQMFAESAFSNISGFLYRTEKVIEKTGEMIGAGLAPLFSTAKALFDANNALHKAVVHNSASIAMYLDRIARAVGTDVRQIAGMLSEVATYFGYSIDTIIKQGTVGVKKLIGIVEYVSKNIGVLAGTTANQIFKIFGTVLEKTRWTTSDAAFRFIAFLETITAQLEKLKGAAGPLVKTAEDIKQIYAGIASSINEATWELYLGVRAATGRFIGSIDEMIYESMRTPPLERMVEIAKFFREVAKVNAGLTKTWIAFTPPFKSFVAQHPEMIDVLQRTFEAMIDSGNVTKENFRRLLESYNVSAEMINQAQLALDALGDPLEKLVIIAQRILDTLITMVNLLKVIPMTRKAPI